MAGGWAQLGDVLGGGIDRDGAYNEGRLRTAQTEDAISRARQRQLDNIAAETKAETLERMREEQARDPNWQPSLYDTMLTGTGADYAAATQGRLRTQEYGFRDTLGDPNADPLAQFAAGQGVQGKVLPRVDDVGTGLYTDLTTGLPNVQLSPIGEAMVREDDATARAADALTNLRTVQAGDPDYRTTSGGAAGGKVPMGYEVNPNYDPALPDGPENPKLRPTSGGPADINTPTKLGSRERQVVARIFNAAANTAADLQNITSMPSGASAGFLGSGVGASAGTTLLEATWSTLKNQISPEEVDFYNATLGGLSNQLSTLEKSGLAGSDALAAQYDSLKLVPTDTVGQKMYKLALMRQTVESALQVQISQGILPRDMVQYANQLLGRIEQAVPFSPRDVIQLQQSKNPGATLRGVMDQYRGAAPADTANPVAPDAAVPTGADADGWYEVSPGVRVRLKPGQ